MNHPAAGGPRLLMELRAARRAVPPPDPADLAAGRREPGHAYRAAIADLTDAAVVQLWDLAEEHLGEDLGRGVALACVGSLGRRDGGQHADLDLVLLHDGTRPDWDLSALTDLLWPQIRRAGLHVDHSVRTLADCRAVASTDVAASVGLVGMRHLAGDAELGAEVAAAILADWRGAAGARLRDLAGAVASRERRLGLLADLLEPDLKECRGGLRDARIVDALHAARPTGAWTEAFADAVAHLGDVRDALHRVTDSPRNRLTLHHQDAVAEAMGLGRRGPRTDDELDGMLAALPVEGRMPGRTEAGTDPADELLAGVGRAGRTIRHALDDAMRSAVRAARPRRRIAEMLAVTRPPRAVPVAGGLLVLDDEVVLAPGTDPRRDPLLPLRAARTAVDHGLPLSVRTAEALARCPDPAEAGVRASGGQAAGRWPAEALDDLLAVLAAGTRALDVLDTLDVAGVLARWLPGWGRIRDRPQRTAVHSHRVDRHILLTVLLLAEVTPGPALDAAGGPADPRLLLAALLHDLGKLPGEDDHAARGARVARPLLHRLGVDARVAGDVLHLVAEHLLLAEVATGADVDDPAAHAEVARRIGTRDRLHLLRALTEADARATGPRAWTPWRAERVDRLVAAVDEILARGP